MAIKGLFKKLNSESVEDPDLHITMSAFNIYSKIFSLKSNKSSTKSLILFSS